MQSAAPPRRVFRFRATSSGACSTTSSGPRAIRSGSGSSTSTTRRSSACRRTASTGTATCSRAGGAHHARPRRSPRPDVKVAAVAVAIAALAAAGSASSARLDRFVVRAVATDRTDPQLVNAWGLAASPTGPWWVANEARASSTLYDGEGRKQALTVRVIGGPQGVAYYGGRAFVVHSGRASGVPRFL